MSDLPTQRPTLWWQEALSRLPTGHRVSVHGAEINYLAWPPVDASRPLLVFAHGYHGHAHWWDWIAPFFTDRFRVVALDFSGMGDSDRRQSYEPEVFSHDLFGVIAHLQPAGGTTVIGHSFGGVCLLRACAQRPEAIGHAIVVDSLVPLPGDTLPEMFRVGRTKPFADYASARARFRLLPDQPVGHPELLEHLAYHSVREDQDGWRWKFDINLPFTPQQQSDGIELLRQIRVKTDFVYGELSALVDARRARRIVAELARSRTPVEIPQARHHVMLDQPLALVSALRALLAV